MPDKTTIAVEIDQLKDMQKNHPEVGDYLRGLINHLNQKRKSSIVSRETLQKNNRQVSHFCHANPRATNNVTV